MLDPEIRTQNKTTMNADELAVYFDKMTSETEGYIYGENTTARVEKRDFMFDAMSWIGWNNVLDIIGVEATPFQPIAQITSPKQEHKKLREAGKLAREVMKAQNKLGQATFLRSDVTLSIKTLTQFHDGNLYPGLRRGHLVQDRINIDNELRIGQYFSPNPSYVFHVQFFYPGETYQTFHVEAGEIVSGKNNSFAPFVQSIIKRLEDLNIRPRHPQYNEHGTKDISFVMTIVQNPAGRPEVFSATAFGINDGRDGRVTI